MEGMKGDEKVTKMLGSIQRERRLTHTSTKLAKTSVKRTRTRSS